MTLYGNRIAQRIHDTSSVFENDPVSGERSSFTAGSIERTDQAARAAAEVFKSYDGRTTRTERAEFLRTIAAEIATRGPQITAMGVAETGLPAARRKGERGRTTGQLRLFAEHIETADYLNVRHDAVVTGCGLHRGTFSLLNDGGSGNAGADSRSVGAALVQSPHIKAVGFTGSLRGGRALYDLACSRAEPIPFFGELGSVNPVFILPAAARAPGAQLGKDWAGSLTLGVGQFCTDPGIVIMPAESAKVFEDAAFAARADVAEPLMLTTGIASAYRNVVKTLVAHPDVRVLQSAEADAVWRRSF